MLELICKLEDEIKKKYILRLWLAMSIGGQYICLHKDNLSTEMSKDSSPENWVGKEKRRNNYIQSIRIHNTVMKLSFVPTVLIAETITNLSNAKQTMDFDWNLQRYPSVWLFLELFLLFSCFVSLSNFETKVAFNYI